jgi:hypothetical protein
LLKRFKQLQIVSEMTNNQPVRSDGGSNKPSVKGNENQYVYSVQLDGSVVLGGENRKKSCKMEFRQFLKCSRNFQEDCDEVFEDYMKCMKR